MVSNVQIAQNEREKISDLTLDNVILVCRNGRYELFPIDLENYLPFQSEVDTQLIRSRGRFGEWAVELHKQLERNTHNATKTALKSFHEDLTQVASRDVPVNTRKLAGHMEYEKIHQTTSEQMGIPNTIISGIKDHGSYNLDDSAFELIETQCWLDALNGDAPYFTVENGFLFYNQFPIAKVLDESHKGGLEDSTSQAKNKDKETG